MQEDTSTNETTAGNGAGVPATAKDAPTAPPGMRLVHPLDLYLEREPGGGLLLDGEFININGQTGAWTRGANKTPIGPTVPFLANLDGIAVGWVKMVNKKIVEREIGFVADGYERLPREELDDTDERRWPVDEHGERQDPWKPTTYLPMRCLEDGEPVIFGPFAPTQLAAIKRFVKVWRRTDRGGKCPAILLQSTSFKNQKGGTTHVPDFKIVGQEFWEPDIPASELEPVLVAIAAPAKPAKPAARALPKHTDMDDEIPF
jgi:hypothetical protein